MTDSKLDAQHESLRETIRATLARDPGIDGRNVRTTIEPSSATHRPALDDALALLTRLGAGDESLELRSTLGEGGMGVVHLAQQFSLDRHVAVKRVRPDARSAEATLKLLREAWVTGSLEHPNVVPVYDVRLDAEGHPQIVLKKISGSPWCDLMADAALVRERFHATDLLAFNLDVLMQVAGAIHYAHRRGIVHRDLKPENVMIGEFGEVYVVDWGLALALTDDGSGRLPLAKDAIELAGTPCYMAPEMAGGGGTAISERTDVFLLGAMLLEIVAQRMPRVGDDLLAILGQIFVPFEIPDCVPGELGEIIARATKLDPAERYGSAAEFERAVAAFVAHRGSLELTDEADERLGELERESTEGSSAGDERRLRLYHLFGECRFGFQQALRSWPENERAKQGLARAIETMVALELDDGDPRAAAVLLASLPAPSRALADRVFEAKRLRDEEDGRRASLVLDQDPNVGRRTRVFVGVLMATMWTVGPLLVHWLTRRSPEAETYPNALVFSLGMVAVAVGLGAWARDSLSRSAINRGIVGIVAVTLLTQLVLVFGGWVVAMPIAYFHLMLVATWVLSAGTAAITFERRLWPSVAAFAGAFFGSALHPEYRYVIDACANGFLLANVAFVWGDFETDVVERRTRRIEERRERWEEFLARRRGD